MPEYVVTFDRPVVYQPNNARVRVEIDRLSVHAPTPEAASVHALRTTRGDAQILRVELADDLPAEEAALARARVRPKPVVPPPVYTTLAEVPRA